MHYDTMHCDTIFTHLLADSPNIVLSYIKMIVKK